MQTLNEKKEISTSGNKNSSEIGSSFGNFIIQVFE
jgi:hypothetical protein